MTIMKVKDMWSYGDSKHRSNPVLKVKVSSVKHFNKKLQPLSWKDGKRKIVFGKINGKGKEYAFFVGTGDSRFREVRK